MDTKVVVGLIGAIGAGKDYAADALVEKFDYVHIKFADALWLMLLGTNPYISTYYNRYELLSDVMASFGDITSRATRQKAKEAHPEIRRLLQTMGTEGVRNVVGKDVWVNIVKQKIQESDGEYFVISDVRFENEAKLVSNLGGQVVRITRIDEANPDSWYSEHSSESFYRTAKPDLEITNNGYNMDKEILRIDGHARLCYARASSDY